MIIRGDQVDQHDVRPAPWTDDGGDVSALMRELLGAGTVQRWELLRGALELARREAGAQALEALARQLEVEGTRGHLGIALPDGIRRRAELHRAGEL